MAVTPLRRDDKAAPGSGLAARLSVRADAHRGPTSGLAPGYVQGNLAILPKALGRRFPALLPAQPEAVPADRDLRAGRSARAGHWAKISTSAPTCRATGCGATASW